MKPSIPTLMNERQQTQARTIRKPSSPPLFFAALQLASRHKRSTKLFGFFAAMMMTLQSVIAAYTVTLEGSGSFTPIANHLNNPSGNTLNVLFPGATDGDQVYFWDCAANDFNGAIPTYSSFLGQWDQNPTLNPGQGAMYVNQGMTRNVTFTGAAVTPVVPPALPCACDTRVMLSSQSATVATWGSLMGAPPINGSKFIKFDVVNFDWVTNKFENCAWTLGEPQAAIGESVWVVVPCTNSAPCNPCTNNLVVNGSFEITSPTVPPNTPVNYLDPITGVPGWTTTTGNTLEVWGNTYNGLPASEGTNHMEINAQSNDMTVSQVVTNLSTNCPITICFDYTGRFGLSGATYNNDFTFSVSGGFTNSVDLNPPTYSGGWTKYCVTFIPTSSSVTISFRGHPHYTNGSATEGGAHLDNVTLVQCCTNTPCTNPVTVTCSTNKSVNCGTTWSFDAPIITEVGGGTNYSVSFTTTTNGPCPYAEYTRNWTITDACGNTNHCSQTVTVTNPVPLLGCATNKTVQCGSAWSFDPPTVLNGSCSNTTTVLNTFTNGSCPKNITRMWLVSNPCGFSNFCSQTVSIIDHIPPTIQCANPKTIPCGSALVFDTPTATDNCSGTNVTITILNTVTNGNCPKLITRTWKATDQCGNFSTCSQTITVTYTSLTLNCTTNKTVQCGSAWTFDAPTLMNSGCGTLSVLTTYTNGTDCSKAITRIWVASNSCGASSTCTQIVSVVDTVAPSLCCPNDITIIANCMSNSAVVNWKVKVTDNCSSGLVATCNPPSGSSFPVGTTTVSCTATDACGNVGTCSFKVTVKAGTLMWKTVTLGKQDCFKNGSDYLTAGVDYTPRSLALKSLGTMQGFDGNAISATKFGASFLGLSNNINCATLEIWMRPNSFGSNYPASDTLSLGLTNYPGAASFAWTNYIGATGNPSGILPQSWLGSPTCGTKVSLDLANLPTGGLGYNLLSVINQTHRLDMFIKSLTEVDYARLCYCYCASKPIWKGLEWDMSNAQMYRSCFDVIVIKPTDTSSPYTFGTVVGQAHGVGYGFEPFTVVSNTQSIKFTGQRVSGASPNQVTVFGNGNSGLVFKASNVRSNVTQLQVTLYSGNAVVSQSTLPWSASSNVVTTGDGALLGQANVTSAGDKQQFKLAAPVQMTAAGGNTVTADSMDIKFVGASDVSGDLIEGLFIEVEGLDEIELNDITVQTGDVQTRVTGEAVASVSGETTTITAIEMATNNLVGFTIPVANVMPPIVINPVFNGCRVWYQDGGITGTLSGIGNATFTLVTNIWKVDCTLPPLNPTGIRYQVLSLGAVIADTGANPVNTASVTSLPNQWRFSNIASNGVFRMNWSDLALFTINGNNVVGDELRIIPLGNVQIPNLTTLAVTSQGIESLVLSTESAPTQWTMLPLVITGNQLTVQWTGPSGGLLESAPTVFGPWTLVPNQTEFSTTMPMTAPAQFFRVRSN